MIVFNFNDMYTHDNALVHISVVKVITSLLPETMLFSLTDFINITQN